MCSKNEVHLGNCIGNYVNASRIASAVSDLNRRFHLVYNCIKHCTVDVKYKLFKAHCMCVYGSQLWDFSKYDCENFYIAWRKTIRRLLGLPDRTHCELLNVLCKDFTVEQQLHARCFKFYHGLNTSDNVYLRLCSKLVKNGSRSSLANSLNFLCHKYSVNKFLMSDLSITDIIKNVKCCVPSQEALISAGAIRDFVEVRNKPLISTGDRANYRFIINHLCLA